MGLWKTVTLQELVDALNSMGYDCYFEGTPTLTRLTGCWVNDYEFKQWYGGDHIWYALANYLKQVKRGMRQP